MSVLERSIHVTVGAVDLAVERVRAMPAVEKLREASLYDRARELEPRLRRQADQLQTRGEKAVERVWGRLRDVRTDTREQAAALRSDVRKQLTTLQRRSRLALRQVRPNGAGATGSGNTRVGSDV